MTQEKDSMIIVHKSGYMGSRKPCNGCNKCGKDVNKTSTDVLDNESDLEPLYPLGVRKIEGEGEEEEQEFEPLLPVGVETEN